MKYILTCNDSIQAMAREKMTVTADTLDEAWEKAKQRFARKFYTRKMYVAITGVERIGDQYCILVLLYTMAALTGRAARAAGGTPK